MSNELSTTRYEPTNLEAALVLAATIHASRMYVQYKSAEAIAVAIMVGAELGLTAMQSLRSIHIINGKPCLAADLLVGLVKSSPVCEWFSLVESTNEVATYATQRMGEPNSTRYTFDMADAKRARLLDKDTWKKYPAAMLRARCSAALARAVYPDVVAGIYDPDEMESIDVTPAPSITRTSHAQSTQERQPKSLAAIDADPTEMHVLPHVTKRSSMGEDESITVAVGKRRDPATSDATDEARKVEEWNAAYPPGTAVTYFPIRDMCGLGGVPTEGKTRSRAQLVAGTACVWMKGRPGAVSIDHLIVKRQGRTFSTAPLRVIESGEVVKDRAPIEPLPTVPKICIEDLDPERIKGDLPAGFSRLLLNTNGPEHADPDITWRFDRLKSRSKWLRETWLGFASKKRGEKHSAQLFNLAARLNDDRWRDVLTLAEARQIREWIVTEFARPKGAREFTLDERTDPDRFVAYCDAVERHDHDRAVRDLAGLMRASGYFDNQAADEGLRRVEACGGLTFLALAEYAAREVTRAKLRAYAAGGVTLGDLSEYEIACAALDELAKLELNTETAAEIHAKRKAEIKRTQNALGLTQADTVNALRSTGEEQGSRAMAARAIARLHAVARQRAESAQGEVA